MEQKERRTLGRGALEPPSPKRKTALILLSSHKNTNLNWCDRIYPRPGPVADLSSGQEQMLKFQDWLPTTQVVRKPSCVQKRTCCQFWDQVLKVRDLSPTHLKLSLRPHPGCSPGNTAPVSPPNLLLCACVLRGPRRDHVTRGNCSCVLIT